MENIHKRIVEITADILKSWTPSPGTVSPFSSSSSQHAEQNDNHIEYYVPKQATKETTDVASIFNSDLFTNGGEKMTDKALDVNTSETTENSYTNPGSSTTEPDPQSGIAITKAAEPTSVGTTANTTQEAPAKGETTEPMSKDVDGDAKEPDADSDDMKKAEDCPTCGKTMTLCECSGMSKAEGDKCPSCGQAMPIKKAEAETKEEDAKETPANEKQEMKKSIWGGSFEPFIKTGF